MRIPESQAPLIKAIITRSRELTVLRPVDDPEAVPCPLYQARVSAGFPSPADDYIEGPLDINQYLVERPAATFFVRVEGDSMTGAGIHPGDILVVDRSLEAVPGKVIIAVLDGDLTVKRLLRRDHEVYLCPENDRYPPIRITEDMDFQVWGVVRHVVHSL
jgi:DNA polymerase V